jgi:hypothetical protein
MTCSGLTSILIMCENSNSYGLNKHCTYYRSLPEEGILSQAETCRRTNQQINNTVQHVGIDSL